MKKINCLVFIVVTLVALSQSRAALPVIPEDETGANRWLQRRMDLISEITSVMPPDYIHELGRMLVQLKTLNYRKCEQKYYVIDHLEKTLISTPGHAEFYDKRIRKQWQGLLNARGTADEHRRHTRFLNETFYDFPVLRHMPSPETVRVLGEMIQSEEHIRSNVGLTPMASLAGQALVELHHLPLQTRPIAGKELDPRRDLETYRLWYAQIKAGNRTFRFEGDPNEYTLAGPVRASAEPTATTPRTGDTIEAVSAGEAEFKRSTPWFGVMLGGVLVVGGLVYLVVSRGSRARPN